MDEKLNGIFRHLLRTELTPFIEKVFRSLNPGENFCADRYIDAIAYRLELVRIGEIRRLVIAIPPRHLKSTCASVAFVAWALGQDPTRRIICASYGKDLADNFSIQTRKVIESDWYKRVFPNTRLQPGRITIDEFHTTSSGYRIATSVGGPITGRGGNLIIIDDPLKAADAHSETARENAKEWFRSTLSSRLDNPKEDAIVIISQRLHSDDLVGLAEEQGGWNFLNLPAIAEEEERIPIGPGIVWRRPEGNILNPERIGLAELDQLKHDLGSSAFAAQYQQQPAAPDGNLVKLSWFQRYDEAPSRNDLEAVVQSWDTASVPGEGNDYSVCTTWGLLGPRIFLIDVFRDRLAFPELHKKALELHRRFVPDLVVVERAGSGIALYQVLKTGGYSWVRPKQPQGDKIVRFAQQTPKIETGSVFLPLKAPWLKTYTDELARFPNSKFDDQVDSTSQFLSTIDARPREIRHASYYAGR